MKKTLDTTGIANELRGASVFFAQDPTAKSVQAWRSQIAAPPAAMTPGGFSEKEKSAPVPTHHPTNTIPVKASAKTSVAARTQAPELARYPASKVAAIRRVVRVLGKEVAFVRVTPAEKRQLGEVVYAYKRQGIKTSENELLRIGLAFLLADYADNETESVLARAIAALNA
jgi:hypothetical protein